MAEPDPPAPEPEPDDAERTTDVSGAEPAARHWLVAAANQAALAGTTAHVPAAPTRTYGTPTGPVPPAARHRAVRRRARKERARRGLLGHALGARSPRHARPGPTGGRERTVISEGVTARGCAAVVARARATVRPGGRPPDEPRRPVATAVPARFRRIPVGPFAVLIVLVGVFATGLGLQHLTGSNTNFLSGGYRQPPRKVAALQPSQPTTIAIPDLELRAPVHSVGLTPDGAIEVPALERHHEAAWFNQSPTPGEMGPSVILGHVDSRDGPSVFYNLRRLQPGARIEVNRQDRSRAVFRVESVERFNKRALPNDRVYGDFSAANLRLITCGGQWVGGETGYADNVIVFASLVSTARDR
ncbi:class F sortase [Micromonospora pattaloongensis]|nr:class F sortase [Micromonospora pattaloongensis]